MHTTGLTDVLCTTRVADTNNVPTCVWQRLEFTIIATHAALDCRPLYHDGPYSQKSSYIYAVPRSPPCRLFQFQHFSVGTMWLARQKSNCNPLMCVCVCVVANKQKHQCDGIRPMALVPFSNIEENSDKEASTPKHFILF